MTTPAIKNTINKINYVTHENRTNNNNSNNVFWINFNNNRVSCGSYFSEN